MGIKEGLTEIWEDLMSYRTLKVVKISDKRLAYVHKTLMASILVYSFISMIGGHTYMLKEKPRLYVTTNLDDKTRLANFTEALTQYCNSSYTDFAGESRRYVKCTHESQHTVLRHTLLPARPAGRKRRHVFSPSPSCARTNPEPRTPRRLVLFFLLFLKRVPRLQTCCVSLS